MIDPKVKEFVEATNYRGMLRRQRFAPLGSKFFTMDKDTWEYWTEQFNAKRAATGDNGVADSKAIGW